jgi:DNA-binding transcriptional regulator YiaG
MMLGKENQKMPPEEIRELMRLRGWNTTRFANEFEVRERTVENWLKTGAPSGPPAVLLRQMLEQARSAAKARKAVATR